MRKFAAVALLITAVAVPVVGGAAPTVSAATVPSGFVDSHVASLGASTGIVGMPDGTVMVLEQTGLGALDPRRHAATRARTHVGRSRVATAASGACWAWRSTPTSRPTASCTCTTPGRARVARRLRQPRQPVHDDGRRHRSRQRESCWSTTSRRTPAITTVATSRSATTGSCTSRSATPAPTREATRRPTTPRRTFACSTARSSASCRRRAARLRATR